MMLQIATARDERVHAGFGSLTNGYLCGAVSVHLSHSKLKQTGAQRGGSLLPGCGLELGLMMADACAPGPSQI